MFLFICLDSDVVVVFFIIGLNIFVLIVCHGTLKTFGWIPLQHNHGQLVYQHIISQASYGKIYTAIFVYDGPLTLLSYCPPRLTKKKVVMMLSTLHVSPDNSNEVDLPEIIHCYIKTKEGVNVFNAMAKK